MLNQLGKVIVGNDERPHGFNNGVKALFFKLSALYQYPAISQHFTPSQRHLGN